MILLKRTRANVIIATNGQEALETLIEQRIDVILMDSQMPIMDGFETTEIIRNHESYDASWIDNVSIKNLG